MTADIFKKLRDSMIETQIERRGIRSPMVLEAFREIPRHIFVSENLQAFSYDDTPLDIGNGQTISQPYMVALMTDELELTGNEKVLEIGTGSGYQTAILAVCAREVYTIDVIEQFKDKAKERLDLLGLSNVFYFTGDGTKGLPAFAPYDRIIVTAGAPSTPASLLRQLENGGIIVIPVGNLYFQELIKIKKENDSIKETNICGCRFVPLKGEEGWKQ